MAMTATKLNSLRNTRRYRVAIAATIVIAAVTALVRPSSANAAEPVANSQTTAVGIANEPVTVSAVIELFTSQGCSSCPPADRLLQSYAKRQDVMALSYPVDYWDYLGWKDTLASEKNSERQRGYAKTRGDGSVYTPQAVINGVAHAVGSDRSEIEKQIAKTALKFAAKRVPIRFWRTSNMIIVETASAPAGLQVKEATIWLAPVREDVEVEIEHGENHGKSLKYCNVVHELMPIGVWTGQAMRIQLAARPFLRPGNTRYAVLMQEGTTGAILGAAWMGW